MDRVFLASDLRCAAQAAAIEAGRHQAAGQRVLLVSNNAPIPELTPGFDESEEFVAVAARFDRVVRFNRIIEPYHPLVWRPVDRAAWEVAFREALGFAGDFGITLVEPATPPSPALVEVFPDAPVEVLGPDGDTSELPRRAPGGLQRLFARFSDRVGRRLGHLARHGPVWLRALTFRPR